MNCAGYKRLFNYIIGRDLAKTQRIIPMPKANLTFKLPCKLKPEVALLKLEMSSHMYSA